MELEISKELEAIIKEMGGIETVLVNAALKRLMENKRKKEYYSLYENRNNAVKILKQAIYKTREEMIEDLKGISVNADKLSNEELEILYNNEFYLGFKGKEYKLGRD